MTKRDMIKKMLIEDLSWYEINEIVEYKAKDMTLDEKILIWKSYKATKPVSLSVKEILKVIDEFSMEGTIK